MPDVGDAMSQMPPLSFGGIEFPYQEIVIKGGGDDVEHKYPHTAGAANEKQGRELYHVSIKTDFHNDLAGDEWADLYPHRLEALIGWFEQQNTDKLRLPNKAPFQAYCTNWKRTLTVKVRSGEAVELDFKEDRNEDLTKELDFAIERRSAEEQLERFNALGDELDPKPSIFDQITDAINGVLGYLDTAEMYGSLVAAKIAGVTRLLRTADETVDELNHPRNHEVLEALHDLWDTMLRVEQDLFEGGTPLDTYTVPTEMTATEISIAIYLDASKTEDILALNVIEDAMSVPAGTKIYYYPA
jgi:hypothetical protein